MPRHSRSFQRCSASAMMKQPRWTSGMDSLNHGWIISGLPAGWTTIDWYSVRIAEHCYSWMHCQPASIVFPSSWELTWSEQCQSVMDPRRPNDSQRLSCRCITSSPSSRHLWMTRDTSMAMVPKKHANGAKWSRRRRGAKRYLTAKTTGTAPLEPQRV